MVRVPLVALALALAGCASAPETSPVVVTFDRSVSMADALRLVHAVAEGPAVSGTFAPTEMSASLASPPSGETVAALFAGGAVSVEVIDHGAQFEGFGLGARLEALGEGFADGTPVPLDGPGAYGLRVAYPSTVPTADAVARFEAAVGAPAAGVTAYAPELTVADAGAAVAERLRTRPEVLGVRPATP